MSIRSVCHNCGSASASAPLFARADVTRCEACGGWSYTRAVEVSSEELYDESYFNGGEYIAYDLAWRSHARNFRRKLDLLEQHGLGNPGDVRLLELGCATGAFMQVARHAGIRSMLGVEPSVYCRTIAARRGCATVSPLDRAAARLIDDLRPNLIVAWDVWEHLPNPVSTLDQLLSQADSQAIVALTTVDAGSAIARMRRTRWRQFHPPTHLNYPTRRSLRAYFDTRGFAVRYHRTFGYYRPLFEYLSPLGIRLSHRKAALLSQPIYLNLYDTQMLIARRRPG